MNESVRNKILKDANGDIGEHLHNHIHLTSCIHLKHHMHKQSPILADGSLMRDLIVLQQSRSLRDPTASLPSFLDLLPKKDDENSTIREIRKSAGIGHSREWLSGSSPPFANAAAINIVPGDVSIGSHGLRAVSSHSNSSGIRDSRRIKGEKHSQTSRRFDLLGDNEEPFQDQDVNVLVQDVVCGNSESKGRRSKQRGNQSQDFHIKTLSQQLREAVIDSDVASSNTCHHGRLPSLVKNAKGTGSAVRGYNGLARRRRHKFRGTRRARAASASRDTWGQSELPITSNLLAQCSAWPRFKEEEEYGDPNVAHAPRNGCGIPWKWSRIHDRGKTFLDMAGRSFSCGHSDSRLKKDDIASRHRDNTNVPVASNHSSSSTKSDAEALPLLVEASASHESADNAGWVQDYSRELAIYADHLLKSHVNSNFASEARPDDRHKYHKNHNGRHQYLTEKYMPRTFKDLVGQNLLVQALSNAVTKRKVGLLYVFYGPHGTGKTSCARIFARALNCQSLEHPKPCSFCNSCIAHDMGRSQNIREVGPVCNFDYESIIDLLDNVITSDLSSHHKVFVFDDCDTLSPDCWSAISKVVDQAPRRVVIILVCLSLDVLPHIIRSRCQKFFFPKLKDADIISTLQWIASKEDIDIEKDALKLIASRSDGSLRDAEMTLEQLSLLGQKIFITVVQELVGVVSDEKLVDLLDLALSADTVNTVKNLRVIMETGVEPLALMSQLATVITDILAGSYDFTKERHKRKFFQRQPMRKESMEKLRQALKTLSEAEKQLRMSNDRLTWLTAALLQLAPDRKYLLPRSSTVTNFKHGTLALNNTAGQDIARNGGEHDDLANNVRGLSLHIGLENLDAGISGDIHSNGVTNGMGMDGERNSGAGMARQWISPISSDTVRMSSRQITGQGHIRYEEIWLAVLDKIQINNMREFLYQEGRLISVNFGAAPTVQLMLSSLLTKSKAEKFNMHILRAFESVLGSPVTIEIRCGPNKERSAGLPVPPILPASKSSPSQMGVDPETKFETRLPGPGGSLNIGRSGIVEMCATPRENKGNEHVDSNAESTRKGLQHTKVGKSAVSRRKTTAGSLSELCQSKSLVRSKVSLAHVLQQAEGCTQQMGWSRRKAVSIAEKLEQENLRLEPRSRSLLCWKVSEVTRRKFSRSKKRTRNQDAFLKLVSCGNCLSSYSPK